MMPQLFCLFLFQPLFTIKLCSLFLSAIEMSFLSSAQRDAVTEEFNEFVEQLTIIGWKEMRSWSEFGSCFKLPDSKNLEQRVTANFLHYRTNYLIITASIFILRILLAPLLFLSIVCCAAASAAFILLYKQPIKMGDFEVTPNVKLALCGGVSAVFLALCGAVEHLLWGVIYSVLLCAAHMVFRPRSISSKSNKVYEEMKIGTSGWFGGSKKEKSDHLSPAGHMYLDPEDPGDPGEAASGSSMRKRASPRGGSLLY
jgi:hypothetical protein